MPQSSTGRLTLLRVHDLGTGWGPPGDFLDCEAVIRLDTEPGKGFGFQLRNDAWLPARQDMLELLRLAFKGNRQVTIDYEIEPGKQNGTIIRVEL